MAEDLVCVLPVTSNRLMKPPVIQEYVAAVIGRLCMDSIYPYLSPFYKRLSMILPPGLPDPIPMEHCNMLLSLDTKTLVGWLSRVVEDYWDTWWIPGLPAGSWNGDSALKLFTSQVFIYLNAAYPSF